MIKSSSEPFRHKRVRQVRSYPGRCFRDSSGTLDVIDSPVDYDHLIIKVCEGAEAEIAMIQDGLHANHARIDAHRERPGSRYLEDGMDRCSEIFRQGRDDDGRWAALVLTTSLSGAIFMDDGISTLTSGMDLLPRSLHFAALMLGRLRR